MFGLYVKSRRCLLQLLLSTDASFCDSARRGNSERENVCIKHRLWILLVTSLNEHQYERNEWLLCQRDCGHSLKSVLTLLTNFHFCREAKTLCMCVCWELLAFGLEVQFFPHMWPTKSWVDFYFCIFEGSSAEALSAQMQRLIWLVRGTYPVITEGTFHYRAVWNTKHVTSVVIITLCISAFSYHSCVWCHIWTTERKDMTCQVWEVIHYSAVQYDEVQTGQHHILPFCQHLFDLL